MRLINNPDSTSQSPKNQDKRLFFPSPHIFGFREALDIWFRFVSYKGQMGQVETTWRVYGWMTGFFYSSSETYNLSGVRVIDLSETRWGSQASFARSIGLGLCEYTTRDIKKAEKFLTTRGLIQTKTFLSDDNSEVRCFGLTEKCLQKFYLGQWLDKERDS